jgi:hypothetical protein
MFVLLAGWVSVGGRLLVARKAHRPRRPRVRLSTDRPGQPRPGCLQDMLATVPDHQLASPAHSVTLGAAVLVVDGLRFLGRHACIVARGYDIHASIPSYI